MNIYHLYIYLLLFVIFKALELYKSLQTKRKIHGRMIKTVQKLVNNFGEENYVAAKVSLRAPTISLFIFFVILLLFIDIYNR